MPDEFSKLLSESQHTLDEGFARLPPNPAPPLGEPASAILRAGCHTSSRQLSLLPPPLRRTDAQAAAPHRARRLRAGHVDQPQQPCARRRPRQLRNGVRSRRRARQACSAGRSISAISPASGTFANLEALWVAGQLAPTTDAPMRSPPPTRPTTPTAASPACSACPSSPSPPTTRPHGPRRARSRPAPQATSAPLSSRSAPPPSARSIRSTRSWRCRSVRLPHSRRRRLRRLLQARSRTLDPSPHAAFAAIHQADSIVIDPHKHGLQPYGCGCVLFRDPAVGRFYKHDSPYTYFTSKDLHLGEISLECSRAGASAVALWATQQLLPYTPGGTFAQGLESGHAAALKLYQRLAESLYFITPTAAPQLDILFWAVRADTPEASSALAQRIFDEAAKIDLFVALAKLPVRFFPQNSWKNSARIDPQTTVNCLRSVLMKPDHLLWLDQLWQRLDAAAVATLTVNPPIEPA